jgi:bacterioferritin (cytochrome b1)
MWRFEGAVRDILRAALDRIPAATDTRIAFLDGLAAMSDAERILRIKHTASELQSSDLRKAILDAISS